MSDVEVEMLHWRCVATGVYEALTGERVYRVRDTGGQWLATVRLRSRRGRGSCEHLDTRRTQQEAREVCRQAEFGRRGGAA